MSIDSDIQKIIRQIAERSSDPKLIEDAFLFAKEAYKEKFRISGENYIFHAVRVAAMLDKMNLDPTTIAFGILHDVVDDIPGSGERGFDCHADGEGVCEAPRFESDKFR